MRFSKNKIEILLWRIQASKMYFRRCLKVIIMTQCPGKLREMHQNQKRGRDQDPEIKAERKKVPAKLEFLLESLPSSRFQNQNKCS